jgi:hypothetical protein
MMALGFIVGTWVLGLEYSGEVKSRPGFDVRHMGGGGLWALGCFSSWKNGAFLDDPWPLLFTGSGFVWYGGLIGGVLGLTLCIFVAIILARHDGCGGPGDCSRPALAGQVSLCW